MTRFLLGKPKALSAWIEYKEYKEGGGRVSLITVWLKRDSLNGDCAIEWAILCSLASTQVPLWLKTQMLPYEFFHSL
jgi:hypothetical protein